jgi:predicted ATP-dependent endonuclease of OLD family
MKLLKVVIEAYRSIRERMTLIVERDVTVVLGPNDHGKTNLLSALQHLNVDHPFDPDNDLNWDSAERTASLPMVLGEFSLSEQERNWLLQDENRTRTILNRLFQKQAEADRDEAEGIQPAATVQPSRSVAAPSAPRAVAPGSAQQQANEGDEEEEEEELEEDLPGYELALFEDWQIPKAVTVVREGAQGQLKVRGLEDFRPIVRTRFNQFLPRVELINPITRLSDSVTAEELGEEKNEFMRGIFHYAMLNPNDCEELFEQTDRTQMRISRASDQLNQTLRQSWSQGKDLSFRLSLNSREEKIELQIEDPSVTSTYVRASRRSSGFTHYFSLKTILHARQKDHPAQSYILLFDEPGVFLHPSGQFDLLQVLETLSLESQVLYVTHSLFMINKTFPTRHRLITKTADGTTLEGKPYVGRWQPVLSALGLTLTGSILFANHVVLTEGDSDPIYIYAIMQKAVAAGKCRLDINALAVMSTSESRHADVLLRLLHETHPRPRIAVITDGDKGGKERLVYVHALLKQHEIPERQLLKDTTIEDYLPMSREVYVPAVASYIAS